MKKFDQCPGCKEDLLTGDPANKDKGLRCLECGYTCLATESHVVSSNGVVASEANSKIDYWKRRCQAAENVIESVDTKNEGMYFVTHQAWLEIKKDGEVT